jgi:hypothetical protein
MITREMMVKKVSDVFGKLFVMREGFTPDQAKEYMKKKGVVEFFDEDVVTDFFDRSILTKDMVTCLIKHDESGRLNYSKEGILKVCIFETRRRAHAFVSVSNGAGYAGDHFRRVPENWDDPLALKNRKTGYFMSKDEWIKKVKDHFSSDFYDKWLIASKKVTKSNKTVNGLTEYESWLNAEYESWLKLNSRRNNSHSSVTNNSSVTIRRTVSATIEFHRISIDLKPTLLQLTENGIMDIKKLNIRPIGAAVELEYSL